MKSLFPPVDPKFYAKLERAAIREQWYKKDWQRNFAHMSYDEYRCRGFLNAQVKSGQMAPEQAIDCLRGYQASNTQERSQA